MGFVRTHRLEAQAALESGVAGGSALIHVQPATGGLLAGSSALALLATVFAATPSEQDVIERSAGLVNKNPSLLLMRPEESQRAALFHGWFDRTRDQIAGACASGLISTFAVSFGALPSWNGSSIWFPAVTAAGGLLTLRTWQRMSRDALDVMDNAMRPKPVENRKAGEGATDS